jgi:ubiquinone/menaquinone biosynthesis C-methylase UbiE
MKFTGERYLSNVSNFAISFEHWHRYLFASEFATNKKIFVIACGSGFGSMLLSKKATSVLAVDRESEAIITLNSFKSPFRLLKPIKANLI